MQPVIHPAKAQATIYTPSQSTGDVILVASLEDDLVTSLGNDLVTSLAGDLVMSLRDGLAVFGRQAGCNKSRLLINYWRRLLELGWIGLGWVE